jgi:hypothetical protein
MTTPKFIAVLAAQLVLGIPAVAQQASTTTTTTVTPPAVEPPPSAVPGAFAVLSPGGRTIVDALYHAQTGPVRWSRNQIATAKLSGEGWGQVFHEMREDGLIHAKSLDRVIRGSVGRSAEFRGSHEFHHHVHHVHHEVIVTSAVGAQRAFGPEGREGDSTAPAHSVTTASGGGRQAPTGGHSHDSAPMKFAGGRH